MITFFAFVGGAAFGLVIAGIFGVGRDNDLIDANDRRADLIGVLQSRLSDIADYVRPQQSGTAQKVLKMAEGRE